MGYPSYDLTLNQYQNRAQSTRVYTSQYDIIYPALGLAEEAGEYAGKVKKTIRDFKADFNDATRREALALELGDILWYIQASAADLGFSLEEIAQKNLEKLESRKERGKVHGEGDNR